MEQQKENLGHLAVAESGNVQGHTPGPWSFTSDTCKTCTEKGESEFIINGPPGGYHGQFSHEPDARLIAAAPELLQALKIAEAALASRCAFGDADLCRAAIAKATGAST